MMRSFTAFLLAVLMISAFSFCCCDASSANTPINNRGRGGPAAATTSSSLTLNLPLARYTFRGGGAAAADIISNTKLSHDNCNNETFEIVKDEVLHEHWRRLIRRTVLVKNNNNKPVDFEIVAQCGTDQAVLVFCWDTATKKCTLISEYMPSTNSRMLGLAAGMVEDKHAAAAAAQDGSNDSNDNDNDNNEDDIVLTAAKHELEEECLLGGGTWMCLTRSVTMDKYSTTRLSVYLVLDPEPIHKDDAKPQDDEEDIHIVPGVSVTELQEMIQSGRMTVVGSWASLLALQKLRELNEIE